MTKTSPTPQVSIVAPKSGLIVIDPAQVSGIPPTLTVNEAAAHLKHCTKWVRTQLRKRQISVFIIGGKILIPEASLVLFLQKNMPLRAKQATISK
jgi:hypothetical protein